MGHYQEAVKEEYRRRKELTEKHPEYVRLFDGLSIDDADYMRCPRCGHDMELDYAPEENYFDGKFVREELLECAMCGLRFYLKQEYVAASLTVMVDNEPEYWKE